MNKIPRRRLPRTKAVDRDNYVVERCRQRKVLHVGCSDAPNTRTKYYDGTLLHTKIEAVASQTAGIDVDEESIKWLTDKGIPNVHIGNAEKIKELLPIIGFQPELIVAGEVLEHLSQPLDFLCGISKAMQSESQLLVSVPNAFWLEGFVHTLLSKEKVHQEHVAYYSYYTIIQLMERASLDVTEIVPCKYTPTSQNAFLLELLQSPINWIAPHFAPGYVVVAKKLETSLNDH